MKENKLVAFINYNLTILLYLILFYLINSSNEQNSNSISKIILTIKGSGNQRILGNLSECISEYIIPNEIYINNNYQEQNDKHVYYLSEQINNVTMIWNTQISTCGCMFRHLPNITHIDLSSFDTSSVTYMNSMFSGCSSLISLNLDNFDTSQVIDMRYLFQGCSSLISLNLHNFDTSQVTDIRYVVL